jgi:hypothetical protein
LFCFSAETGDHTYRRRGSIPCTNANALSCPGRRTAEKKEQLADIFSFSPTRQKYRTSSLFPRHETHRITRSAKTLEPEKGLLLHLDLSLLRKDHLFFHQWDEHEFSSFYSSFYSNS